MNSTHSCQSDVYDSRKGPEKFPVELIDVAIGDGKFLGIDVRRSKSAWTNSKGGPRWAGGNFNDPCAFVRQQVVNNFNQVWTVWLTGCGDSWY